MKNFKCPCRKCLVQPTCKIPCDPFGIFMKRVDKLFNVLEQIADGVDEMISVNSKTEVVFEWFLENIITPVVFYLVKSIFVMDLHETEWTLFDERYDVWSKAKDDEK